MKPRFVSLAAALLLGVTVAALAHASQEPLSPIGQCALTATMLTVDSTDPDQVEIDRNRDGRYCSTIMNSTEVWQDNEIPLWVALDDLPM